MSDYKGYNGISMKAGTSFDNRQYCIVTGVAGQENFCVGVTTSTKWPIGLLQNRPNASGKACDVAVTGVAKVKIAEAAGSKLTIGSPIVGTASSFGHSLEGTEGIAVGRALYGGSSGDVVPCLLNAAQAAGGEQTIGVK